MRDSTRNISSDTSIPADKRQKHAAGKVGLSNVPSGTDRCSGSYVPWLFGRIGSHTSLSGSAT